MNAPEALSERPPTPKEVESANAAAKAFAGALTDNGLPFSVRKNGSEVEVELPPALGQLMLDMLSHVARGEMITFVPYGAELTTKEAADILNVSRPFLVKLLEEEKLPHHKVGTHRRVRASDVLAFKSHRDRERKAALEKLQHLGQEFDAN